MYKISDVKSDQDILGYIGKQGGFSGDLEKSLIDYTFLEIDLEELGLPSADQLLESVKAIENEIGLKGWKTKDNESKNYKGFSLTYNPDFIDSNESIYHQTFGSNKLTQSYGRAKGLGEHNQLKNTYYDSYAFRKIPPIIQKHLGYFLDKFSCHLVRSRVAYLNMYGELSHDAGWHVDEPPYCLFRINIPLQTSDEYYLKIKGKDDYNNELDLYTQMKVGKAYFWNTRIPHTVGTDKKTDTPIDRIHLVLGFSPWYDYDEDNDAYIKSKIYGMPIIDIIKNKRFLKI